VEYVEPELEVKPVGYPATLVTTKTCSVLSINTTDLLRFGTAVKEAIQSAAWVRRETFLELQDRMTKANDKWITELTSARSMPGTFCEGRLKMVELTDPICSNSLWTRSDQWLYLQQHHATLRHRSS
jgi:hypothetical protein